MRAGSHQLRILAMLRAAYPRMVETADLLDAMYWDHPDGGPKLARVNLAIAVLRLRQKIGHEMIENRHSVGYRLTEAVDLARIDAMLPLDRKALLRACVAQDTAR